MALIGRKDAWALSAISAGIIAANPWLAGNPMALAGLVPPIFGGAWLAWKGARRWLDQTDTKSREGFVLPSDEVPPECMQKGTGLRFGYTTDEQRAVDIHNDF